MAVEEPTFETLPHLRRQTWLVAYRVGDWFDLTLPGREHVRLGDWYITESGQPQRFCADALFRQIYRPLNPTAQAQWDQTRFSARVP